MLNCSSSRLLSVRCGGILTSETVKIANDLLCALWTIIIPVLAAFVNSVSLFLCKNSNKKPMAFAIGFVFSMQKHRKKQEMCHFLAPVGQPEMMHKNFMHQHLRIFVVRRSRMKFMLYFPLLSQGRSKASSISSSSAFPVSRKPSPRYRCIAGTFSGAHVITTLRESPNGFPAIYSRQSRMASFA